MGKEKIRGQTCMKENFEFGNLKDGVPDTWAQEEPLPGFRGFCMDFYQVCIRAKQSALPSPTKN